MCKRCDKLASTQGLCSKHYMQFNRNGACLCGRPWSRNRGQKQLNTCQCGAIPPAIPARQYVKSTSLEKIRQDRAGVVKKFRNLTTIGRKVDKLKEKLEQRLIELDKFIIKIEEQADEAGREMGLCLRKSSGGCSRTRT